MKPREMKKKKKKTRENENQVIKIKRKEYYPKLHMPRSKEQSLGTEKQEARPRRKKKDEKGKKN